MNKEIKEPSSKEKITFCEWIKKVNSRMRLNKGKQRQDVKRRATKPINDLNTK